MIKSIEESVEVYRVDAKTMRRWLTVSAAFGLTWLAVTVVVAVSQPLLVTNDTPSSKTKSLESRTKDVWQRSGAWRAWELAEDGPDRLPFSIPPVPVMLAADDPFSVKTEQERDSYHKDWINELSDAPEKGLLSHNIPPKLTVFQEHRVHVRLARGPAAGARPKKASGSPAEAPHPG